MAGGGEQGGISADWYLRLLDNLTQAVFLKDKSGRLVFVNESYCELMARRPEELIGRSDHDLFLPKLADKYRADDEYVIKTGLPLELIEENPAPDGSIRYVQVIKKPLIRDGKTDGVQGMFWDVTEQMRTRARSREHEERFERVARATNDTVWDWDLVAETIWWSEGISSVWGYAPKEVEDSLAWWTERLHPDDRDRVEKSLGDAMSGTSGNWSDEYRFQAADGAFRTVLDRGLMIRNESGEAVRMIGSIMDLSERKKAEDDLKRSEERFRQFMDNSTAVAWVKDGQRCLRYVNAAFEEMFQMSATELLGKSEEGFLPADVAAAVHENDQKVLTSGKPVQLVEHVPGADGKMRHWLVSKFPFPGDDGEDWVGGTAFEITDRMATENALRESEERLRLTIEAAQDAMWDLDFEQDTCWWNQPHEALLGPLPDKPKEVRQWWKGRLHPDDRAAVLEAFQLTIDEPGANHWTRDYRVLDKDGETLFVQDRAYLSRDEDGQVVRILGALRDLTKLRRQQEERERLGQKMLEAQKLESLGVLAGGIAHDFNNLLTSILGNINLAQLELNPSSPLQSYLEDVEKSSIRAADLCRQMLAYSGKGRFVVRTVSLTTLVEEMMQLLEVSISKTAVLKYDLARGLPPISADPTQLRQIVMNLVVNASEALGDKSGIIHLSTGIVRAEREYLRSTYLSPEIPEGDYVYLEINDTGCGMDKETLDRIFDPFFTTKFTGRGLGLPAVLGIVRGHEGALRVYSEPARGSTFKLLLPCAPAGAEETEGKSPLEDVKGSGLVLVVDDEETVRTTTARMLESGGYKALIAEDGCEGLAIFKKHADEIQVVMLDLTMPHMDGVETFREIRQVKPDAAVILMSGYNQQEAVQHFTGKGLAGFIQKPFPIATLLGRVREVLDGTSE